MPDAETFRSDEKDSTQVSIPQLFLKLVLLQGTFLMRI